MQGCGHQPLETSDRGLESAGQNDRGPVGDDDGVLEVRGI